MRLAFFHDHWFRRGESGAYYSTGGLPYRAWSRYLTSFDELVVVGRERELGEIEGTTRLTIASGPRVEMACVDRASRLELLTGGRVRANVRAVLAGVDAAVVRLPSLVGLIACREAVRAGVPWMVEVVACPWDSLWNHGSPAGKPAAPLLYALNRHYIRKAPFALYVSEKFLQRRYPCGGETVGCSNVMIEAPSADILDERLARIGAGHAGRPVRLGLVGSLDVSFKGHETAIRALRVLKDSAVDARLCCLGPGDATRWRSLATALEVDDRIEFCGTRPAGGAVLEWMSGLDVFLIPSLQEGLPRALVEAMSRGLPAVGARTGGIPELIDERFVHAPRDHHGLAGRVNALLGSPSEMQDAARANFRTAGGYAADVLEKRRNLFIAKFAAFAAAMPTRSSAARRADRQRTA
jgi:glycosyltransferase involved in cell wall biosynthesis